MELISKHGSISAAGKEMGMSYRRAWMLVDEINQIFREPLVDKQMGGSGGGGARLTQVGPRCGRPLSRHRGRRGQGHGSRPAGRSKASLPSRPKPAGHGGGDLDWSGAQPALVIALSERHAPRAQDVVGGDGMEIEVG